MQYSSGRRNTFGSGGSASKTVTASSSRLSSIPANRPSTRGAYSSSPSTTYPNRYSSTYNTSTRPLSTSATRYSRFSTSSAPAEPPASSKFRTSRYDSHYSTYGTTGATSRRSSEIGSDSRYTSPATSTVSTRPYVTASSGVSTSRESSLSKSWPSPARNLGSTVNLPRVEPSVRSSSSTVSSTVAARQRRSPAVGGSVPALPSSTYSGSESRRASLDLALNRTPSSSTLNSQISRRYLGSGGGSGALDGNFDAGRAESLYRPSTKYTSNGSNRFLTSGTSSGKTYDLDTVGVSGGSRRSSVLSTSSARAMSRSPVRATSPSSSPGGKSLWNKHYGALSARWAEQTGASLSSTANGRNQYSYRPVSLRKMSNGAVSDGSIEVTTGTQSDTKYTRRSKRKNKVESDGYDSSSSSDGEGEKKAKTKTDSNNTLTKTPTRSKRTTTNGTSGTGSFRRTRASGTASTTTNTQTMTTSSGSSKKQDGQPSSSDNETAQDSLDARIKARRKRLQKSKAMLQEHKEDGWNYRRTLQIEESKQRQQTSAAATISYSRNPPSETIKRDQEQTKPDPSPTKVTAVDELAERKPTPRNLKDDLIEPNPPSTPSTSLDHNASGVRVQKIYLQPLKSNWKQDPVSQSDQDGDESISPMQSQPIQAHNEQVNSVSTPAPVNSGVKKSGDQEKSDRNTTYRRSSSIHRSSPMTNRGISNERTPPPPISQRQDFNYNQYVNSIAPKQVSYENPAAALMEADHQQQMEDLPKVLDSKVQNEGLKEEESQKGASDKVSDVKINTSAPDHTKIRVKTKPIRSQPPSVVVITAVSPPSAKRNVNKVSQASPPITPSSKPSTETNSLNTLPTPFRRTSASPVRTQVEEKPPKDNPVSKPKPISTTNDDDERKRHSSAQKKNVAEPNYAVVNGARTPTPDVLVPITLIPAKSVPEKITPTFTPTFTQPSQSQLSNPGHRMTMSRDNESTPLSVANTQKAIALAAAKDAEEKLRLELKKHQRREDLRKETAADMHRLPSVDREMLNLLTLGEELNNSRSSISSQIGMQSSSQQSASKFAQSFRTAMPQKGNVPVPPGRHPHKKLSDGSVHESRESLNSYNVIPKPWRPSIQGSREGSSESLASSFATATSTGNLMRGSKDSLNIQLPTGPYKDALLNVYPKPWSSKLGKDRLSTSAEPLATVAETPGESAPIVPPRSHGHHSQNHTNSLDLATRKVDEMLRLAKLKHQQQQRRERIILLQSQVQHPHNLTVITTTPVYDKSHNPITDASRELDKAYEAIQLDYAEAQESRQRHQRKNQVPGARNDNENVFVRPQLVTVFSTVHMPSPRRAESGDETGRRRGHYRENTGRMTEKEQAYLHRSKLAATNLGGQYDNSKLDYTKRWLEGDLKSLTRDPKPDLLQFGSAPRLEFDQRSVGSASAEVAAITNKERLQGMREVPDLVPQQQHHQQYPQHQQSHSKPHLVKPSPQHAPNKSSANQGNSMLAPVVIGNFLGPRVGQPGSKSSSFAGGLPSVQGNGSGGRPGQHPGQRHQAPNSPHQPHQPMVYNSGGIRQAGDQLRSSVESLPHSERSWTIPKNCALGSVRKQVDMFDRMSDNDSELSFRSADNVAYRSALYKPSRRLSLTDHMSNFVRRFESDEESNGSRGSGFYRRPFPQNQPHVDLHSDDEVRLAAMRTGTHFKRPLAHFQQMQANGGGSTQSLPVAMPYQAHKIHNGNIHPAPGHFQQAAPHFFAQQRGPGPARNISQMGSQSQEQITPQQQHRKIIPPWLRHPNRTTSPKQQYWSSNSTLTDLEAPGVSQYYPSHNMKHMHHSTDTMQAVDSLVAELELNTDASGSVISQRSTSNFPVDRFYYHNHYQQADADRSSSRSKLNVIPEQAEQQHNQLDTLHVAQRRLEEARKDLKNVSASVTRRQMGKERPHGLLADQDSMVNNSGQDKPLARHHFMARSNEPANASLPRSFGGVNPQQQHPQGESVVKYRPNKSVIGRPASYAAPGAPVQFGHSFMPSSSTERIERKYSAGNEKEEDNYDNVIIGRWQQQRSQVPEPPRSAMPTSNLHSPGSIKIGSIVLGRSGSPTNDHHDQMGHSRNDKQQQGAKNPLKNFLQLFNKNGNKANGDVATNDPSFQIHDSQRSYHETSSKAPSSLSLNVASSATASTNASARNSAVMTGSIISTSDGNHFRKSCSTNDAYTLKPIITPQEMRQLDELLTSFHEDGNAAGNTHKKSGSLRAKAGVENGANGGAKQEQPKAVKAADKTNNNAVSDQRTPSKFKLGLPAFWKRA